MTEHHFTVAGHVTSDNDLTIKQIAHKLNSCIDWGKAREEGLFVGEPTPATLPLSSRDTAPPGCDRLTFEGQTMSSYVTVYLANTGQVVVNGVAGRGLTNEGHLYVDLPPHDETFMVSVVGL